MVVIARVVKSRKRQNNVSPGNRLLTNTINSKYRSEHSSRFRARGMMQSVAYNQFAEPKSFNSQLPEVGSGRGSLSSEGPCQRKTISPSRPVRMLQSGRKGRISLFGADLFSDPAWDILLELYALHLEQQRASVSFVYAASGVPASTALRWVAKLEGEGFIVRIDHPTDARCSWLELTPEGLEKMTGFFEMLPLATQL